MFGIEDYSKPIIDFANLNGGDFGTALAFGGIMLLIGMLTVFAVLCTIWACLSIFKVAFHGVEKKEKPAPVVEVAPVATPVNDDTEIIAVIAAAIAMAESENGGAKFRVVSFNRK